MKFRILDEAISDLRPGAQFYKDQSAGLGTCFLDTLFSDIESLDSNYPKKYQWVS
jgi:hypothetical protein